MSGDSGIFNQLKKEHKEVAEILDQLGETGGDSDTTRRAALCSRLYVELTAHARGEQKEFYARVQDLSEATEEEVEDDLAEHHEIEGLLGELMALDPSSAEWLETLSDLQSAVEHHVDDEEEKLFPEVMRHISGEESEDIRQAYVEERDRQSQALRSQAEATATTPG
jgi:hemerythrin superfamily protein